MEKQILRQEAPQNDISELKEVPLSRITLDYPEELVRIILLCAGYATRLYPLTENQPKPLLSVGGRPILEWILDSLKGIPGISGVYAVTNHKFAGHFETWAKTLSYDWKVETVDDGTTSNENRLGAIGDLNYVLQKKKIGAEDLLVVAGDNFFDFDLSKFLKEVKARRPYPVIAVYDVKDIELAKEYGLVKIDPQGRVIEFFEKPKNPPTTLASCGLYWLPAETRVLLDKYLRDGHNSDQPGHYMKWLAEQARGGGQAGLMAVALEGHWLDIGDRKSYDKANASYSEFNHPKGK